MGLRVKRNLGNRVFLIAEKLNIPRVTVERVIKEYLNSLVESGLNGENIVIDNIMSIKLLKDVSSGDILVRGRVSPAFKEKLSDVTKLCTNL